MREPRTRRLRRFFALLGVALIGVLFLVRLTDVQLVSAHELNAQSHGKRAVPVTVPAVRGDIVDRNGNVLATTNERYDVQLSPKNTRVKGGKFLRFTGNGSETETVTTKTAFEEISKVTGQSVKEIEDIVDKALAENPKSDFAYVKRRVTLSQLNDLKKLQIPWLTFSSNFNRTYPNGAVAGNIIGFTGDEGNAQAGIELSQNHCLAGRDGSETYERSADGVPLPGSSVTTKKVRNGGSVQLTIDRDLQWQAQQITNTGVDRFNGEWAMMVVMDAKTGELVAVAEDRSVDPNNVKATPADRRDSRAFAAPYEPGSSYKTFTTAALIDKKKAKPTERVTVPPEWNSNGARFGDWYVHGYEQKTLAGVIQISSNIGTATFGQRLPKETRYEYLRKFGIGQPTKAGMPVESPGLLRPPGEWDPQTNFTTMFGQGMSATIIQTANAYQAIANKGVRVPARLVTGCTDADGKKHPFPKQKPVRVISPKTAEQTDRVLETVVDQPWLIEQLDMPGYRIAAKTATAQQPDGHGGYRHDFVYSFAGYFPADNPRYVVVSSLAFPKGPRGSDGARVMWSELSKGVIRHFQVPPSTKPFTPLPVE